MEFELLRASAYLKASSLTVLVYDWVITFPQEVDYIWSSRWNIVKVLFLFIRYTTVIDTVLALRGRVQVQRPNDRCNDHFATFNTIFSGFGISFAQLILMTWTYSLYGKSRRILAIFGLSWLLAGALSGWAAVQWMRSTSSSLSSSDTSGIYCFLPGANNSLALYCYGALLAAQSVVVILTIWKSYRIADVGGVRSIRVFKQCGTFFYIAIWAISFATVLLLLMTPQSVLQLDTLFRVMHTVLGCRLVMHVRAAAFRRKCDDTIHSKLTDSLIWTERPGNIPEESYMEMRRYSVA